MITTRRSAERGHFDLGWLSTYHTFSFGNYRDPDWMGFRTLRVLNEDFVQPGQGFGEHGHRDMEIVSYVISGALQHWDDMGNGSTITRGRIQRMTAGRGVKHAEKNGSDSEVTHLIQIWIVPESYGLDPSYEEKEVSDEAKKNVLKLIASQEPDADAVKIHQDASIYASILESGVSVTHTLNQGRHAWLHLISGAVSVNDEELKPGDSVGISDESEIYVHAKEASEILLFDLS
jgi:redox-sensitive bicupin YhaK (pirin superfamily)